MRTATIQDLTYMSRGTEMQIIQRIATTFSNDGIATLQIPNGAKILGLKFADNPAEMGPYDPQRRNAMVGCVVLYDPTIETGTHSRTFLRLPDGMPVPPNFLKYIASYPFGPQKSLVHVIEIGTRHHPLIAEEDAVMEPDIDPLP